MLIPGRGGAVPHHVFWTDGRVAAVACVAAVTSLFAAAVLRNRERDGDADRRSPDATPPEPPPGSAAAAAAAAGASGGAAAAGPLAGALDTLKLKFMQTLGAAATEAEREAAAADPHFDAAEIPDGVDLFEWLSKLERQGWRTAVISTKYARTPPASPDKRRAAPRSEVKIESQAQWEAFLLAAGPVNGLRLSNFDLQEASLREVVRTCHVKSLSLNNCQLHLAEGGEWVSPLEQLSTTVQCDLAQIRRLVGPRTELVVSATRKLETAEIREICAAAEQGAVHLILKDLDGETHVALAVQLPRNSQLRLTVLASAVIRPILRDHWQKFAEVALRQAPDVADAPVFVRPEGAQLYSWKRDDGAGVAR